MKTAKARERTLQMGTGSRLLHPATNPAGYTAMAGTVYAAAVMIYNAYHHHGVIDVNVIIAAIGTVAALLTRQVVTPVADPVNGAGVPLVPAPAPPPDAGIRIIGGPANGAPSGS